MDEKIAKLKSWIDECSRIVFFGGAGVSTESGVPDFRSVDGLYNQQYDYPPETILSHTFFMRKPEERDVLAELAAGGAYEDADGDIWDGDETESAEKLSIRIRVEDPILSANCHTYEWILDEEGSEVQIADGGENAGEGGAGAVPEPDITVTPEELVCWLFGKDSMYHIWPEAGVMTFTLLNQVDVIKGVYLDELV